MGLPHFTNVDSHMNKWEPIFKSLYEVTIILPTPLQAIHPNATHLLLENAVSVTLPEYPDLGSKMQRFKYSTRVFITLPENTSLEAVNIKFNLNQDDNYQVFCWRIMKDWYDMGWNVADGSAHYKKNMTGDIIIHLHDKEGHVIRRITYYNAQIKKIAGWSGDVSWEDNQNIVDDFQTTFVVDYWDDLYY
jgi:hypothetical protein